MSEDQIIALLGEIRDLQKQHIENYKMALANQQQALDTQKQSMRRARTLLLVVAGLVLAIYLLPAVWWGLGWGLRCALLKN
jgi:fatty acid desaturase